MSSSKSMLYSLSFKKKECTTSSDIQPPGIDSDKEETFQSDGFSSIEGEDSSDYVEDSRTPTQVKRKIQEFPELHSEKKDDCSNIVTIKGNYWLFLFLFLCYKLQDGSFYSNAVSIWVLLFILLFNHYCTWKDVLNFTV